jgi:hypothetical protein
MKKLLLVLVFDIWNSNYDTSCGKNVEVTIEKGEISKQKIEQVIKSLLEKYGEAQKDRIERGVNVVAKLWTGSESEFEKFCLDNFVGDENQLEAVFNSFLKHWETLLGNFNRISLDLKNLCISIRRSNTS